MKVTIEQYVSNDALDMCQTTLMQDFHSLTIFDLTSTLLYVWHESYTYMVPTSFLEQRFPKDCVRSCY